MCIRDSEHVLERGRARDRHGAGGAGVRDAWGQEGGLLHGCLLYTSDAADERSSVDLGGRRIIKKKKTHRRGGGTTAIKAKQIT